MLFKEKAMMSKKAGLSTLDVLVSLGIIIVLVAVLLPFFSKARSSPHWASCQSNLTQIGRAFKMYLSDWDETYPTNRALSKIKGKSGAVVETVKLTPAGLINAEGSLVKFLYGINWVEGLYSFTEAAASSTEALIVWRCPQASSSTYPANSKTAYTSYVFNRNLVEVREKAISNASNLMLVREMDRRMNADLRPINCSARSLKNPPISSFLTRRDVKIGKTRFGIHGKGSHILFADGHVKFLYPADMPEYPTYDPTTQRWYNFANTGHPERDKSIAITP